METKSSFLRGDCPKSLVDKKLGKVKYFYEVGNKQQKEKGILFVITYHRF